MMQPKHVNVHREAHHLLRRKGNGPHGLYVGTDFETNEPVYVGPKHLGTHLEILGPTGSGKSRWLLWLFELLCSTGRPIILADFKGGLYQMAKAFALANGYTN